MTIPVKVLYLIAHAALVIGLLAHSNIVSAQVRISPGDSVQGRFTKNGQEQQYTVMMESGERLLVHMESVGETLSTNIEVFDPVGNSVAKKGWLELTYDLQSPVLSAQGAYLIKVWNTRGIGEYKISVGTIDRQGREIPPGSRVPEGPRSSFP